MVQQDGRVLFSMSALLNAGKMMTVFCKDTYQYKHSIVPSCSSAHTRRLNCFTLHEHCDQTYTRMVTV